MKFVITGGKGMRVGFSNGYELSVQFGPGNYCSRKDLGSDYAAPKKAEYWESEDAEIAVFFGGEMLDAGEYDQVIGHINPDQVARLMAVLACLPADYGTDIRGIVEQALAEPDTLEKIATIVGGSHGS